MSGAREAHRIYSLWPEWGLEINAATAITLLIFVGAMSKSAQVPLHMWLPDSLYAPTPVHALLHAGIINAGGFLLARLAPLYDLSPTTLHVVFAVGLLTAILGSSMMLTQNDIKKTLGYSTIGQMGFMIMECGLGAYALAIFHLIAHGIFKATIFLNCGHVIHAARQEPRFPFKEDEAAGSAEFSGLAWLTGFITTLILPLIILLAGHGLLRIPLSDSQGTVIFLFFGWATSSQAILTLYRLRAVASWKVAMTMLFTLFVVVVTYLLAAESFTYFLFPSAGEAARHFKAGALPVAVFDLLVVAAALFIVLGWILIYANAHGRSIRLPAWVSALQVRLYLFLMNRLYLDALALRVGQRCTRVASRLNASVLFPYVMGSAAIVAAVSVLFAGGIVATKSDAVFSRGFDASPLSPAWTLRRRHGPFSWLHGHRLDPLDADGRALWNDRATSRSVGGVPHRDTHAGVVRRALRLAQGASAVSGDFLIGLHRLGLLLCSLVACSRHSDGVHASASLRSLCNLGHRWAFTGKVTFAGALWRRGG